MKQYLEIAKIINTHGIRGDLKLDLWCDSPDTVKHIKTLYLDDAGKKPVSISGDTDGEQGSDSQRAFYQGYEGRMKKGCKLWQS